MAMAMAITSPARGVPYLRRSLPSRSILTTKLIFFRGGRSPRLVSVRSQTPTSGGFGPDRPVSLENADNTTGLSSSPSSSSSSSVIDFLTLCHRLKVRKELSCLSPSVNLSNVGLDWRIHWKWEC